MPDTDAVLDNVPAPLRRCVRSGSRAGSVPDRVLREKVGAVDTRRNVTWAAAALFVVAVAVAVFALLAAASLVREYGAAEGYGNLTLQVLPIVAGGLLLAGLIAWMGSRLHHRGRR